MLVTTSADGRGLPVTVTTGRGVPIDILPAGSNGVPVTVVATGGMPVQIVSGAFNYDMTAIYAAMTVQPDAARKAIYQTLMNGLSTAGLIARLRALYLMAAHDAQAARVNLIFPGEVMTEAGLPGALTFTADSGYQADGITGYLETGINDNDAAPWSQTLASMSVWMQLEPTGITSAMIGVTGGAATRINGVSGSAPSVRIHLATATTGTTPNCFGMILANRNGTALEIDRDGVLENTTTSTAGAPLASSFQLFKNNLTFGNGRISAAHIGGVLTPTQKLALYNALYQAHSDVGAA
jgi:hypothetical protein